MGSYDNTTGAPNVSNTLLWYLFNNVTSGHTGLFFYNIMSLSGITNTKEKEPQNISNTPSLFQEVFPCYITKQTYIPHHSI